MRRFHLLRQHDASGVSGTGYVAEGIEFTDGTCVLRWLSRDTFRPASGLYDSIADVEAIHGHGGATVVDWIDVGVLAEMAQTIRRYADMRPLPVMDRLRDEETAGAA